VVGPECIPSRTDCLPVAGAQPGEAARYRGYLCSLDCLARKVPDLENDVLWNRFDQ
jgi:hypothetical protein